VALESSPETPVRVFSRWTFAPRGSLDAGEIVAFGVEQKERFDRALLATGCCTIVDSTGEADVVLEGTYYGQDSPLSGVLAAVSLASLSVIPAVLPESTRISALARAGPRRHSYDVEDSMLGVIWLPLIVMTPFANAVQMAKDIDQNVRLTLIERMKRDGLLEASAATRPERAQKP
jgi:hypothetical protein